jgi:Protein of unknown function (DUF964).
MEIYEQLYDLINGLKKEECYLNLLEATKLLDKEPVKELLIQNKEVQERFLELKKYDKYIDLNPIKKELKAIKDQMANNSNIRYYYKCYNTFNNRLQTISHLLFKDISEDLSFDQYIL